MKRVVDTNELKDLVAEFVVQGQDNANKSASITFSRLFMDVSNKLDNMADILNDQKTALSNQQVKLDIVIEKFQKDSEDIKKEIKGFSDTYVTKERFVPVESYLGWVTKIILGAVIVAILALVIKQ